MRRSLTIQSGLAIVLLAVSTVARAELITYVQVERSASSYRAPALSNAAGNDTVSYVKGGNSLMLATVPGAGAASFNTINTGASLNDPSISGTSVAYQLTSGNPGIYLSQNGAAGSTIADGTTNIPGTGPVFDTFNNFFGTSVSGTSVAFAGDGLSSNVGGFASDGSQIVFATPSTLPGGVTLELVSAPSIDGTKVAFYAQGAGGVNGIYTGTTANTPITTIATNGAASTNVIGINGFRSQTMSGSTATFFAKGTNAGNPIEGIFQGSGGALTEISLTSNIGSIKEVASSSNGTAIAYQQTAGPIDQIVRQTTGGGFDFVISKTDSLDGATGITSLQFQRDGLDGTKVAFTASFSNATNGVFIGNVADVQTISGPVVGKVNLLGGETLTIANGGTLTSFSSVSVGTGTSLTVQSGGALTATNQNVNVNGLLTVNGTVNLGNGGVVVNNGGTLKGNSTINGTLTINNGGTLASGNSPGTTAAGNTTFNGGGNLALEVNSFTGAAGVDPGWDLLRISGQLDVQSTIGNPFNINLTSLTLGNLAGSAANFNQAQNYNLTFVQTTGGVLNFAANKFNINTAAFQNPFSGTFSVLNIGNDLVLHYQGGGGVPAVPEPSSLLLMGVGFAGAGMFKRRRNRKA